MAKQYRAKAKIPSGSPHAIVRDHAGMTQATRRYMTQCNTAEAENTPVSADDTDEVCYGWTKAPFVG